MRLDHLLSKEERSKGFIYCSGLKDLKDSGDALMDTPVPIPDG